MTKVTGASASGVGTCLVAQPYKLVLDIGYCSPEAVQCQTVLVSHAHVDHMAGAVQHAASRSLAGMSPSIFVCSPTVGDQLEAILELWKQIQGDFQYEILRVAPDDGLVQIGHKLSVRAVPTMHTVPSQGYVVYERRSKLKPEYEGMPGMEIGALRKQGVEVQDVQEFPVLAFMGDTRPQALANPEVRKAQTVVTECTFLGGVPLDHAQKMGHTHVQELPPYVRDLECESLVLMHFSLRHSKTEIFDGVDKWLSPREHNRLSLRLGGEGPVVPWE